MISLRKGGVKIALIKGGKYNKQFLYLHDKYTDNISDMTFEIKDEGMLQPLPHKPKGQVEKLYVSAPSGAGKSFFTAQWVKQYLKKYKNNEFYLFSSINEDEALDKNEPVRIDITEDILNDPIQPEELANSVVVFDDVDTIRNPLIKMYIARFRDFLLEQGRHSNIDMVITSHVFMDNHNTKRILNEATAICFFPRGGSGKYHIKRFLKVYAGLEDDQIKKIFKLKSRWVCFYRTFPNYIIHEKGAYIIHDEDEK